MANPLVQTKLYLPRLRRSWVRRPRLSGRLLRGSDARLTLISAPAGFGKTTLLAAWLADATTDNRSVAWLSLDQGDRQPATFWTYVITALQAAVPGVGADVLPLLQSAQPPIETVLVAVLNELSATPNEVVLVLDDYHLVDGPDLRDGMTFLLEHLPPHIHLVISSRADPLLPLARLRARGELVEVRAADLRFTPDEVATYLNDITGLDLTPDDIATLEGRTEGWIAALQLAAISMQGRTDIGGFIAQFAGNDRYIVDYLVEEVLQQQTDPVREFLLHTAVLDRLTGPLCDTVTGRDDGSQLLITLERANLFLVPLDDRREWFRYHHLFADVLRAHLLAQRPDLVPQLHQRASLWYERHNHTEEAVRHALAARDFDRAAYLMELAAPVIRRHRQEAVLFGWLQELPEDAVRRSPVLNVFYGFMLMVSGDLAAFEARLDDAESALAAVPDGESLPWADTTELQTLPATIAIYRASLAQARGDVPGTAENARRALDFARPDDHLARGGALGFLGLAAWAAGDVTNALETFTQAVASLRAAGNLADELSSTVLLADMWLAAGQPSRARRLYQGALQVADAHGGGVTRAIADLHVGISEIDLEIGDIESANRELQEAAALGELASMSEGRYRWFLAMGRVADAAGDPQEAITLLDQAQQLYRPGFFPGRSSDSGGQGPGLDQPGQPFAGHRLGPGPRRVREGRCQLSERVRPPHLGAAADRAASIGPGHRHTRPGCRSVEPARRRRRELRSCRQSARDPHAAGLGTRRAGASTTGPAIPGSRLGRGARARRLRSALPGRGRCDGRAAGCGRTVGRRWWPCESPAQAQRRPGRQSDRPAASDAPVGRAGGGGVERPGAAGPQTAQQ